MLLYSRRTTSHMCCENSRVPVFVKSQEVHQHPPKYHVVVDLSVSVLRGICPNLK